MVNKFNLDPRNVEAVQTELAIRDLDDEIAELGEDFRVPRFGDYTLKGGDDYQVKTFSYKDETVPATRTTEINIPGRPGDPIRTKQKADFSYRGGHFGIPGEFAHVRFKERNIEGKKTLFIEEMQSDLGQSLANYGKKNQDEKIDIPFKNTWYELVFKRMIRDAADKGMDQIAIPSGVVAARRYKMDRRIMNLDARKSVVPEEDEIAVTMQTPSGKQYTEFYSRDEISKIIPNKDILQDLDNFYDNNTIPSKGDKYYLVDSSSDALNLELDKSIEIVDPKKKGKVALYDKAFPSFLNKYGKKWGSTVKVIDSSEEQMLRPYQMELGFEFDEFGVSQSVTTSQDGRPIQNLLDKRDFKIYVFEISPEMKKSVQEEGQSLFEILGPVTGGAIGAEALLDDKGNNTISN